VSAFAGMIQVFTRHQESGIGHLVAGGGSFSDAHASGGFARDLGRDTKLRVEGSTLRSDGWQDRTGNSVDRGSIFLERMLGSTRLSFDLAHGRDEQRWGTPLKFSELQEPEPELSPEHNYAVGGAETSHRITSASIRLSHPTGAHEVLENTLSFTRDDQNSV